MKVSFTDNGDPFLTPDWRWRTIQKVAPISRGLRYLPDEVTSKFREYIKQVRSKGNFDDSDARCAREIFEENDLRRSEIEARIVADESDEKIAEETGVSPVVVNFYESIFFNVRPYLNTDWLLTSTVGGERLSNGFKNNDLRALWCKYAIAGGQVIIDALIDSFKRAKKGNDKNTLFVYLRPDCDLPIQAKSMIAFDSIPSHGNGELWRTAFGWRYLELVAANDMNWLSPARHKFHLDVIRVGSIALQNRKIPLPPGWRLLSEQERKEASMIPCQLVALQNLFTQSGSQVSKAA